MRQVKDILIYVVVVLVWGIIARPSLAVATAQNDRQTTAEEDAGQASTPKSGTADGERSPALTGGRRPLYRLRKSDVVGISFTFAPEFDQTETVTPDGFLALRGAQELYAEGMTVPALQAAVQAAYADKLNDPEVTVTLKDFDKPYFIAAGEVGHPGKYELRADTTVTEAVAIAGGFTGQAKHSQVVLFRRVSDDLAEAHTVDVKQLLKLRNLAEDIHLQSGDMLFVPQNAISKIRRYLPASNLSMYLNPGQF